MGVFKKTSELNTDEKNWVAQFLEDRAPYNLYFSAAFEALEKGLDNREFLISHSFEGVALMITFDSLKVVTLVGKFLERELKRLSEMSGRIELHIDAGHARSLLPLFKERLTRTEALKYYRMDKYYPYVAELEGARLLTPEDFEIAKDFFEKHYPGTIFSQWMLEMPFAGLFVDGELVATGGTVAIDKRLKSCNIGNFLTSPQHRGKRYCQKVAKFLVNHLFEQGIVTYTLGTTEENVAAWRAYESIGFKLIDRRIELEARA